MTHTATYSPDDNKIRIYPAYRLPADEYQQLKAVGYGWAPKQECFYAVWSPSRENVAIEFAGEIDDEDTSLLDRAEQRAERFEDYSDRRAKDADRAHSAVKSIADNIPFGQPILVGHHSERHARKDAERIENGMRKAVKMWETSEYWTRRAAGALAHAKYLERPDVRARRIKGLESDKRKQEKYQTDARRDLALWEKVATIEQGRMIAGRSEAGRLPCVKHPKFDHYRSAYDVLQPQEEQYTDCDAWTLEQVQERARVYYPHQIARAQRWLDHINNRLAYERAMLAEGGGLIADQYNFQVGGKVRHKWGWNIIKKLNKKDGVLLSLSLIATSYPTKVNVEDVKEYIPPTEEETEKVKTATKLPPMCNYITPECATMTQAEFSGQYKDYKGSRIVSATDEHGAHRIRRIQSFLGRKFGSTSQDQWGSVDVFISDAKVVPAPKATKAEKPALPAVPQPAPVPRTVRQHTDTTPEHIQGMKASLKAGVKTVSAPQLFPTPPELAARMAELADLEPGMTVLEPSAGTGRLLDAVKGTESGAILTAVELNYTLADGLRQRFPGAEIAQADFMDVHGRQFDRILMNPPFENGTDVKHIIHAAGCLKPGGKLVAICAGGPRQAEKLKPLAATWEPLPAGTFAGSGTGVNTVLLTIEG